MKTPRLRPTCRRFVARNLVGPTVRRLRCQQRLTQEDLAGRAARVGWVISRDTVKRIERREREVTDIELHLLAAALRVPLDRLVHPESLPTGNPRSDRAGSGWPPNR